MTLPGAYENSPYRCRYDSKRMIVQIGQHETLGHLEETHSCLECGRSFRIRPKLTSLPGYAELLRRRTAHLDRGRIVEKWIGTMSDAEVEELANAADS